MCVWVIYIYIYIYIYKEREKERGFVAMREYVGDY